MDKFRGKYEIILGFVTLVISLSAFKDELSKVHVDLGYLSITFADYFLCSIIGFSICLYLYILELVARDTKFGKLKIWNFVVKVAYFIFAVIIISPILLAINFAIFKVYKNLPHLNDELKQTITTVLAILTTLSTLATAVATSLTSAKSQRQILRDVLDETELIGLDKAKKLYKDGYYSHAILECYKVLSSFLSEKLSERGYRLSNNRIKEMLDIALKEKIITEEEYASTITIRAMRNSMAHTDEAFTEVQAKSTLEFVTSVIIKSHLPND